MFAFLRPPMIFEEQIENTINDAAGNQIQRLEIEIRDRYDKANNFNPDDCFDTTRSNISVKSVESNDSTDINFIPPTGDVPSQKVGVVKTWSTVAEVTSTIIIVVATILCLIENEEFYKSNKTTRTLLSLLTNSLATEFSDDKVSGSAENYTYYKRLKRLNLDEILEEANSTIIENMILDFLGKINSTSDIQDYNMLDNPLEINDSCASLRWAIVITTLLAGNFFK